jgi:hypothetical protein
VAEQKGLPDFGGSHFVTCRTPCMCYKHKLQVRAELSGAAVREHGIAQAAQFAAHYVTSRRVL